MPNHLQGQTSPYLLQHLNNPVDWWPWGEEAFTEARRRGVPIFLSIGYSTCYWCHVMERESFENDAISRRMNEGFVCIKVDREERPDVDDLYMAATQVMTGHGGWPMSCFLEPGGLRPFWCGTYFPPEPRGSMAGFPQVLEGMSRAWMERRTEVMEQASSVAEAVAEHLGRASAPVAIGMNEVGEAAAAAMRSLDRVHGGFGRAPKFPQPVMIELLLDVREHAGDDATRAAADESVRLTLDKMACGGLHDQVGGGFHRYSVDERWLVPHFEKMLYDNAQLGALYARASRVYGDAFYARVARRTLGYVLREMTSGDGAFWSAQDAEVDGREGLNYTWTAGEVAAALPAEDAAFAAAAYGLNFGPNFKDPHHPGDPPRNVLFLPARPEKLAGDMPLEAWVRRLDRINERLYEARAGRPRPRLDDKVLTSWNGLMIAAMAAAGRDLGEPRFVAAASRAAGFMLERLVAGGDLLRTFRDGRASIPGVLEDYAFLVDGLLTLHEVEGGERWVRESRRLAARAAELFGDGAGGYFDTRAGQSDLFLRARSSHDGALPSGASVMLGNLARVAEASGEGADMGRLLACLASLSAAIAGAPLASALATRTLFRLLRREPGLAARLGGLGPAPGAQPGAPDSASVVEVYAGVDRVRVGADEPGSLRLVVRIKEGYHLIAADPGAAGLVPFRVGVAHGAGVAVYADYPAGEPQPPRGDANAYAGYIEFDVAVERAGEWTGNPVLTVTFQACTRTECLAPATVELDVALDRID